MPIGTNKILLFGGSGSGERIWYNEGTDEAYYISHATLWIR